ncbi:MAG: choice-of-anchor Q domain-containing protein, partial [Chloroflexota bacterium]
PLEATPQSTLSNTAVATTSSPSNSQDYSGSVDVTIGDLFAEIEVGGKGNPIVNGSQTPESANGTSFGTANVDTSEVLTGVFEIANTGTSNLSIIGNPAVLLSGPGANNFEVVTQPTSPIAPASSTNFEITFNPASSGMHMALVTISNNDADENPYTFVIEGVGCVQDIEVSSANDTGAGTLREAVDLVCEGGTITFAPALADSTITLSSQIEIDKDVTIGSLVPVVLSGGNANRIFEVTSGTVSIGGLTLADGSAATESENRGGAISVSSGTVLNLANTTIRDSSANVGGGVYNEGTLDMRNVTISGSSADTRAGAIYNLGTANIYHNTFYGNAAPVASSIENAQSLNMYNTLIGGGTGGGDECVPTAMISINATNFYEDGSCNASPRLTGDPMVGALADNGGVNETHALMSGSPAIGEATPQYCEVPAFDQRGMPRPQGDACDIGAFESGTGDVSVSMVSNVTNIRSGDEAEFTITVLNSGPSPVLGVEVVNTFPANLSYVSGSIGGGDAAVDAIPTSLAWTITKLDANESTVLTFNAETATGLDDGVTVTASATASVASAESSTTNNSDSAILTISSTAPPNGQTPSFGFDNQTYAANEGDGTVEVTVTLSEAAINNVTVDVIVADPFPLIDSVGDISDQIPVSFNPGETSKSVTISIPDDSVYAGVRSVSLSFENPFNAAAGSGAVLEITDNDDQPTLSIADLSAFEGNDGITAFEFELTLSAEAAVAVTGEYQVNGTAQGAVADEDFPASDATGTFSIAPGTTTSTLSISVFGDTTQEADEQFFVFLSELVNAADGDLNAIGTIRDDDSGQPSIFIFLPMIQDNSNN